MILDRMGSDLFAAAAASMPIRFDDAGLPDGRDVWYND